MEGVNNKTSLVDLYISSSNTFKKLINEELIKLSIKNIHQYTLYELRKSMRSAIIKSSNNNLKEIIMDYKNPFRDYLEDYYDVDDI